MASNLAKKTKERLSTITGNETNSYESIFYTQEPQPQPPTTAPPTTTAAATTSTTNSSSLNTTPTSSSSFFGNVIGNSHNNNNITNFYSNNSSDMIEALCEGGSSASSSARAFEIPLTEGNNFSAQRKNSGDSFTVQRKNSNDTLLTKSPSSSSLTNAAFAMTSSSASSSSSTSATSSPSHHATGGLFGGGLSGKSKSEKNLKSFQLDLEITFFTPDSSVRIYQSKKKQQQQPQQHYHTSDKTFVVAGANYKPTNDVYDDDPKKYFHRAESMPKIQVRNKIRHSSLAIPGHKNHSGGLVNDNNNNNNANNNASNNNASNNNGNNDVKTRQVLDSLPKSTSRIPFIGGLLHYKNKSSSSEDVSKTSQGSIAMKTFHQRVDDEIVTISATPTATGATTATPTTSSSSSPLGIKTNNDVVSKSTTNNNCNNNNNNNNPQPAVIVPATQQQPQQQSQSNSSSVPASLNSNSDIRLENFVEIEFEDLKNKEYLDEGASSVVYTAMLLDEVVVVKHLKQQAAGTKQLFKAEAEIMSKINHPNIVRLLGVCMKKPNISLILEYVAGVTMFDLIHDEEFVLHWLHVLKFANDMAQAMAYLHGLQPIIMHRDLKSLNVLVSVNFDAKICDFGFSKSMGENRMTGLRGTYQYMAPEMLSGDSKYDEKVDVYSYGIILWELITRDIPYADLPTPDSAIARANVYIDHVYRKGKRPQMPVDIPLMVASLVKSCWATNSQQRPSFAELVSMILDSNLVPSSMLSEPIDWFPCKFCKGDLNGSSDHSYTQSVTKSITPLSVVVSSSSSSSSSSTK